MERDESPIEKTNILLKEVRDELATLKNCQISQIQFIKMQEQQMSMMVDINALKLTIANISEQLVVPQKQQKKKQNTSISIVPVTTLPAPVPTISADNSMPTKPIGSYIEKAKAVKDLPDPTPDEVKSVSNTKQKEWKIAKQIKNVDPWEKLKEESKDETKDDTTKHVYYILSTYYEKYTDNEGLYIDNNGPLMTYLFHSRINRLLDDENLPQIVVKDENDRYDYKYLNEFMKNLMMKLGFKTIQIPNDDPDDERKQWAYKNISPKLNE